MLAETKLVETRNVETLMADSQIDFAARSDVGRVRENNEDSLRMAPELGLFILSDGMGGQASGEVASRLTTDVVLAHCHQWQSDPSMPLTGALLSGISEKSNRLLSAIRCANVEIREAAAKNPQWRGMGATVVALWLEGDRMSLAHVGDSRAYRFRAGQLEQLTQDHSFVAEQVRRGILTQAEADHSKLQNVLLRALGADPEVDIDIEEQLVLAGDSLLLCSDGLTREVSDAQIAAILKRADCAQSAAVQLINLANQGGGEDNISVIVLRRAAKRLGALDRIGRWLRRRDSFHSGL
jgi:PPM family protein phosphatase